MSRSINMPLASIKLLCVGSSAFLFSLKMTDKVIIRRTCSGVFTDVHLCPYEVHRVEHKALKNTNERQAFFVETLLNLSEFVT